MKPTKPTKCKVNYTRRDILNAQKQQFIIDWVHRYHPEVVEKCDEIIEEILNQPEDNQEEACKTNQPTT